jgi:phenylalanine-4-hydroxylase
LTRKAVEDLQNKCGTVEMAQIRNPHWWTVEYGLIGTVENPKSGAGLLLSSIVMKVPSCMTDKASKRPYKTEL